MPRVPFHSIFQPPARLYSRVRVHLEYPTRNPTTFPSSDPTQKNPSKPQWPVPITYLVTAQANFHHVHPATLLFQNLSHHILFHTPIQPPISITYHHSFHSPHPYSVSHMGYTRPLWEATQVTLHLYSRIDPTRRYIPRCSRLSSRVQGLRRYYTPTHSHSLLPLPL